MANAVQIPSHLQGPGVLIRTIHKGDGLNFPKRGDSCLIQFEAFLEDGTKIDTCQNFVFAVGQGQVVPGWDVALPRLSVGTLAEVTVPPLYAYGAAGCPPHVPPQATLVYRIKVLKIDRRG